MGSNASENRLHLVPGNDSHRVIGMHNRDRIDGLNHSHRMENPIALKNDGSAVIEQARCTYVCQVTLLCNRCHEILCGK